MWGEKAAHQMFEVWLLIKPMVVLFSLLAMVLSATALGYLLGVGLVVGTDKIARHISEYAAVDIEPAYLGTILAFIGFLTSIITAVRILDSVFGISEVVPLQ
jgi:ABC-type multidrug transport system fused ATPase/permease subunit